MITRVRRFLGVAVNCDRCGEVWHGVNCASGPNRRDLECLGSQGGNIDLFIEAFFGHGQVDVVAAGVKEYS